MNRSTLPDARWQQQFRRRLLRWYGRAARDLPWRRTDDPYAIWVSEIMLQQTQVETVKPYYARFLRAFPTVHDLAHSDEQQVLRLWEGLGYYRRARQLHAAARTVVSEHGGAFPDDLARACALPGVGRYTAGAVLSFSRDRRLPVVEANTLRLYSRVLGYRGDPRRAEGQKLLWAFAEQLLPRSGSGNVNQALIELGSRVCTPRNPGCGTCPVALMCAARRQGNVDQIPAEIRKTRYEEITETAVVVRTRGRVLLRQCATSERWAGLWDFPRFPVTSVGYAQLKREIATAVRQQTGHVVELGEPLATIRHGVTRFRITLLCFQATLSGHRRTEKRPNQKWVTLRQLESYPLSVTGRKISRQLNRQTE